MAARINNRIRKTIFAVAISVIILAFSGCAIPIPLKVPSTSYKRFIDETITQALIPTITTRKDVLLLLGEPDIIEGDESVFVYASERSNEGTKWVLFACGTYSCGAVPLPYTLRYKGFRLAVKFDEKGILLDRKYELFERAETTIESR